jgi:hypothetical protein
MEERRRKASAMAKRGGAAAVSETGDEMKAAPAMGGM